MVRITSFLVGFLCLSSILFSAFADTTCDYSKIPILDLETLIKTAISKSENTVNLPEGTFRIPPKGVMIHGAKNLTINGPKTTLVLSQFKVHGITFDQCQGLTLKGFTIDYDELPFTQGTILTKSADNSSIEVEMQDGYPDLTTDHGLIRIHFFDGKTLGWKRGIAEGWSKDVQFITPRKVKISLRDDIIQNGRTALLQVGDMVAFTRRSAQALQIFICRDVRVEDIKIYSAPGLALGARNCDGDNYFRYKVERGPKPVAAKVPRLLSTNADAFNYGYSRRGPTLEGCEFSFMADDGVNLHGPAFMIVRTEGSNVIWCLRRTSVDSIKKFYDNIILPGDDIRILDENNYAIKKVAKIAKVEIDAVPTFTLTKEEIKRANSFANLPKEKYLRITLTENADIKIGNVIDFPAANCSGYLIRNNKIHDVRPRGIRIMASNGIIENNIISSTTQPGINLGCHYAFYREAGWLHDVIIRNNTLEDIGLGGEITLERTPSPAAISVWAEQVEGAPASTKFASEHRNVQIINNKINDCTVEGIVVNGLIDGKIEGNQISNCNTASPKEAMDNGRVPRGYGITVMNSKNLKVENNEFKNASTTKEPVFIAP